MEQQLDMLLQANIISPSISEFASPVILVKKADGSYRLAVDYRKLNKNLIKDSYPIPNITDSVDSLSGSEYFSTLDLTSGFFQQTIEPRDRHKTAIITHKGLFSFSRVPFGLAVSPTAFQRLMNTIFGDLSNLGILVYIDDIVVASKDIESHLQKLKIVFDRLRQHNLKLKPSKCTFLSTKIKYLGFEIQKGQVSPINKNIETIQNFKAPNCRKAVRSFIGTISFYRRFVPDFSKRSKTLINLTKENGRFSWSPEAQAEFDDLKNALLSKPCLALPDFNKQFQLYTDASGEALGAVLSQLDENNLPHPVAFASRKLKDPETRYSATERELLALVWATAHFKCYLANTHFEIFTDHAPLTYMLKIVDPTSRMAKWICTLSDFNFTIKYIQGRCNSVADFLSRYVNVETSESVKLNFCIQSEKSKVFVPQSNLLDEIRELQKSDPKCCQLADKLDKNREILPKFMKFFFKDDLLVCEDTRQGNFMQNPVKLVVPKILVPQVFALTHESMASCHQGFQKTIDRIRDHFYWPGMSTQVRNLVDSCVSCQQRRAHKANQLAPLQRIPVPEFPGQRCHIDVLGPLPITMSGNRFIIAYIDAFTKWPEAYPTSTITSDAVADTLADYISRHGAPSFLVSDNAGNFVSQAIEKVYTLFGIKHIRTTPYHAQSNGQLERQNRTLANALSHIVNENHSDWDTKLKFALLAMRTAVHSSTELTPAAILYGRNLNLPYALFSNPPNFSYNEAPSYCEMLIPALRKVYVQVHENLVKVAESQEKYRLKSATVKDIKVGDEVWLFTDAVKSNQCRKFAKLNTGPFSVLEKIGNVNFKIAPISNLSSTQVVHVNRLTKIKSRMQFPPRDEPEQASTNEWEIQAKPTVSGPIQRYPKRKRRTVFFPRIPSVANQNVTVSPAESESNQGMLPIREPESNVSMPSTSASNQELVTEVEIQNNNSIVNVTENSNADSIENRDSEEVGSERRYRLREVKSRNLNFKY